MSVSGADHNSDLPRNCTFAAPDWRILAKHWYPVALARDLEASGVVSAKLLDEPLVVYRAEAASLSPTISALIAACRSAWAHMMV